MKLSPPLVKQLHQQVKTTTTKLNVPQTTAMYLFRQHSYKFKSYSFKHKQKRLSFCEKGSEKNCFRGHQNVCCSYLPNTEQFNETIPHPKILQKSTVTQENVSFRSNSFFMRNTGFISKKLCSFDLIAIMSFMFVVEAFLISNHTVFAAQRESYKDNDPFSISMNLNAITNMHSIATIINNGQNISNNNGSALTAVKKKKHLGETTTSNYKNSDSHGTSSSTDLDTTTKTENIIMGNGLSTMSTLFIKKGIVVPSPSVKKHGISLNSVLTSIEVIDESRNGPYFDRTVSKNVTALLGKTAYLNCRVKNLGNKTMLLQVSWVRHRDIHLLTVGRYTYTSDQRFRAIHQPQTEDWILQIKYPQHRDSGIYECQVSTTPHMSHYIHLNVVEPSTEIVGAPDLYIENGSTINLTCVIFNSPEPPAYIFWNHNDAIINYDSPRGGVSVVTIKGETTTSFLLIKSARPSDSGHYQCNPSNSKAKMVTVHVLNGEFPAAMQRAGQAYHHMSRNHYLLVYLLIYLFTLVYVKHYIQPPVVVGATVMSVPFISTGN